MDDLITLDEYYKRQREAKEAARRTGIRCPNKVFWGNEKVDCEGELLKVEGQGFSIPISKVVKCNKCGHSLSIDGMI